MCFNKKQLLIIGMLCAHELLSVCTCFYTQSPLPKSSSNSKPPEPPTAEGRQSDMVLSNTVQLVEQSKPEEGQKVMLPHDQNEAKPTGVSNVYEGRLIDAFAWPSGPVREEKVESDLPYFDLEDDLITTATRIAPKVRPKANRRETMLDGTKWALFTVTVISAAAVLYKILSFPSHILYELREIRSDLNKK